MKRRIFNLLAAVSLVLCVATAVLWLTSYWRRAEIWVTKFQPSSRAVTVVSLRSSCGLIFFRVVEMHPIIEYGAPDNLDFDLYTGAAESYWDYPHQFWGFGGTLEHPDTFGSYLIVPHWFLCAVLLIPFCWRRFFGRAVTPGFCTKCGYDLRASKERCPECGTAIPAAEDASPRATG